jgi:hypothetical protein
MAKAAYRRSAQLASIGTPILGIGASCALASEPPKRGEHRAYVAAHAGTLTWCWSLTLAKGARSRLEEDATVSRLLVHVRGQECADVARSSSSSSSSRR